MRAHTLLPCVALALALGACGEKPPRADPEPGHHYNTPQPLPTPMRDRTLHQGRL